MNKFQTIDDKLYSFAIKLNATLSKDRPHFPREMVTFEERRIDWYESQIKKAIIIQPTFTAKGVDSSLWNFINVAWIEHNGVPIKPGWQSCLIDKKDFSEIEKQIDQLLTKSEQNLKGIEIKDVL